MTKICGGCKHYVAMSRCILYRQFVDDDDYCDSHTPKPQPKPQPITNGDKIIKRGNNGLAAFACGLLNDKREETFQRVLSFLNTPAESEE